MKTTDDIAVFKTYFESSQESEAKEYGLRLIEMVRFLNEENIFLKKRLLKAEKDIEWIEKKADEWMLKFMELNKYQ